MIRWSPAVLEDLLCYYTRLFQDVYKVSKDGDFFNGALIQVETE